MKRLIFTSWMGTRLVFRPFQAGQSLERYGIHPGCFPPEPCQHDTAALYSWQSQYLRGFLPWRRFNPTTNTGFKCWKNRLAIWEKFNRSVDFWYYYYFKQVFLEVYRTIAKPKNTWQSLQEKSLIRCLIPPGYLPWTSKAPSPSEPRRRIE